MNDKLKTRPKTASAMTGSGPMSYSLIKSWRTDAVKPTNSFTSRSNSFLGVTGSKYKPERWSFDIGPSSGGFLPVLNISTRPAINKKPTKRTASLPSKPDTSVNNSTAAKSHTATMLDLSTMIPPVEGHSTWRAQRENSLPVSLGSIPNSLRYSQDSHSEFILSRLALLERTANSGDNSDLETQPPKVNQVDPASASPPLQPRPPDKDKPNSQTTDKTSDGACDKQDSRPVRRTHISTLSNSVEIAKEDNSNSLMQDNRITSLNFPRSILKPVVDDRNSGNRASSPDSENSKKQALGVSTFVIIPPLPNPDIPSRQASDSKSGRRKRLSYKGNDITAPTQTADSYSSDTLSERSELSDLNPTSDSLDTVAKANSEPIKSVRFCDIPSQVKEYYPWEAPQHSILYSNTSN